MNSNNACIGLVGSSGYAGQILHALIMQHECMSVRVAQDREPTPRAVEALRECRAVALAIPDEPARAWTAALRERGIAVLDLSGAHRLQDDVHYGIPELWGAPPRNAEIVANPGCYPTASLLALVPLRRAGVIHDAPIAVLGASGTSGAGKTLRDDLHFSAQFGNTFPYKVGAHKHIPEIARHLGTPVSFVTQLLPIVRGILVTAFVCPKGSPRDLHDALASAYACSPHVTVLDEPGPGVGVGHVVRTHQAIVAVGPSEEGGLVPVFCAIDNLMRGAASQALANLNLWLGFPASMGLPEPRLHAGHTAPPMLP